MPPGQRKLRDSCDACHIAKVKCIKTKSGDCLRCTSSSTVCSFSPSDRRGKPRGAKNKCNRVPQTPNKQPASPVKRSSPSQSISTTSAPNEAYPSPTYDLDKYFNLSNQPDCIPEAWATSTVNGFPQSMELSAQDEGLASLVHSDWTGMDNVLMAKEVSSIQQHTPRTSISSTYPEQLFVSPQPFPLQQPHQESGLFDSPASSSSHATSCKCYLVNLQSLYSLHSQAISASSGYIAPFDMALFINNDAIERCHTMLSCSECVLDAGKERTSTNMLILAGAMDDILRSYFTTCSAYLDGLVHDPLIFSSGDGAPGSSSTSSTPRIEDADFLSRTQTSSSSSSSSSSTHLSLGSYCIEGEDAANLKLEILKIELRKVERLWITFRDTCALQNFQDDQKSLYAALVCYLAKRLRSTAEMLDTRTRMPAAGW